MKKSEIFWQTYLNLERELLELSKYVYITDHRLVNAGTEIKEENCPSQLETSSPHIADLLIRTCTEIEALSKELYFELGGEKMRGALNLFFDDSKISRFGFSGTFSRTFSGTFAIKILNF